MKISNQPIALFFSLSILFLSCTNNPPISQDKMWACHHEMTWDSLKTSESLIGTWEWEYIACFWNPEDANDDDFKGMIIEFYSDNTLAVKEEGQITQTSNWNVVNIGVDLFELDVDPAVEQLYGRVLICGDRVEFNFSYLDICDNYFKRKN